jgi:hypothetical protein
MHLLLLLLKEGYAAHVDYLLLTWWLQGLLSPL